MPEFPGQGPYKEPLLLHNFSALQLLAERRVSSSPSRTQFSTGFWQKLIDGVQDEGQKGTRSPCALGFWRTDLLLIWKSSSQFKKKQQLLSACSACSVLGFTTWYVFYAVLFRLYLSPAWYPVRCCITEAHGDSKKGPRDKFQQLWGWTWICNDIKIALYWIVSFILKTIPGETITNCAECIVPRNGV